MIGFDRFLVMKREEVGEKIIKAQSELNKHGFDLRNHICDCKEEEFCVCGEIAEMLIDNMNRYTIIDRLLDLYIRMCLRGLYEEGRMTEEDFLQLITEDMVNLSFKSNLLFHFMNEDAMRLVTEYNSVKEVE